ncbi:uncharacterized protein DNG_08384 [Cephalotrichum gorgonifer]|uniref:RRM domain-containing protein n=1 Tax=Cephalotrichum gorgonifer TaxID=2041049 RepID=A0AAE8N6C9_9PEZI|nr:uncharacterized protein DNG_08384 [Cephalotrichum gorgonifer]
MAALDVEALLDATAKNADDKRLKHGDDEDHPRSDRNTTTVSDASVVSTARPEADETRQQAATKKAPRKAMLGVTEVGAEAEVATMTAVTHVDTEEWMVTTIAAAADRVLGHAHQVTAAEGSTVSAEIGRIDMRPTSVIEAGMAMAAMLEGMQLAARLRTRELKEFFEKVAPVTEAQIVKDRISGRSKGVGYVEFKDEESVAQALQLTGQKLLGIPIIVQVTEAEKNRQVRNPEGTSGHPNSIPFHRLYVGNIHFNVTEQDLQAVFEPFGELEFVQLQKDEHGRSRGYGFVQFRDATQARDALDKMNGFDLAGRPIRVGLGNDKFTPESTANLLQRFSGQNQAFPGSAFSGAGGRSQQSSAFDRAGGRDNDKAGGASALDDTDVAGVNFNNYSRDALMRKLARTDETSNATEERQVLKPKTEVKPLPVNVNKASRCVVLHNMFDPEEEEGEDWVKELEDDVRQEAESKYGHVVHISVDPNSKGDIYLKFDKVQGGENAIMGLNGRYFGGRMIDASPVSIFLECREAQAALANAQQIIRRMPGVAVHQADELCDILMRAGQTFNIAVKSSVEDWAEQTLQANELKKTISNWGQDNSHRDEQREEELRTALRTTLDQKYRLQTFQERFENIQYEIEYIVKDFEKLRGLSEDDGAFNGGMRMLFEKLDGQMRNREKLFSLMDSPVSPSLNSDYGLLEEIGENWQAKERARMGNGSRSDAFSQRSGAPSPEDRDPSSSNQGSNNMQMVIAGPRHPQPHATNYPGSTGPANRLKTPAQQAQIGPRPQAASAPKGTLVPSAFKTPAPSSKRLPARINTLKANIGSPGGGKMVVPSPLESPFEGPDGRPMMPPQRLTPSFRFPGTPNYMPQAVPPTAGFYGRGSGRNMGGRQNRGTPQAQQQQQQLMAQRPTTAFRPQAAEFRPTTLRTMGQNMGGHQNAAMMPRLAPPPLPQQQQQPTFSGSFRNRNQQQAGGVGRGIGRGGGFQASTVAGSSSRAHVGREGLDTTFLTEVEKAIDEFYQLTRGWVADYAGTPDARQALTVKESAVWPAIVAAYPPLTPLEANAYIDIHIRDPLYRPCLISRLIVDFFIGRVWTALAWMGLDEATDRALTQLRGDFERLGPQPAFQRQLLLERQSDVAGRIIAAPSYAAFRDTRIADIQAEVASLIDPLVNRFARRDRCFAELKVLAEQGWEVARLISLGRTHFDFRFPHTGDRFSASAMRPVFPDKPGQQLQAEHWRVSLVVSPSITCIRDNGGRISVHDLFMADVVCMQ